MSYADTLPDDVRRRGRNYATVSAVAGCVSEVMLDRSAILILLFTMLHASPTVTMFSSSLSGVLGLFLMLPNAYLADRIGLKFSVKVACWTGFCGSRNGLME